MMPQSMTSARGRGDPGVPDVGLLSPVDDN
jgi:hypothetical protein